MTSSDGRRGQAAAHRGRRMAEPAGRSRWSRSALAVGLALPLLTAGVLTQVTAEPAERADTPPERTAVTRTDLACPRGRPGAEGVSVVSADGVAGELGLRRLPDDAVPWQLPGNAAPVSRDLETAVVVAAEGEPAAGLAAGRTGEVAATGCGAPVPERWWTGLGARPQHDTVIELVNPDAGPAVADFDVLGSTRRLDVDALRGVRVPGHGTVVLDLGEVVPRRSDIAVRMTVSRGRVIASAWDQVDELGRGDSAGDWLAAQSAPAKRATLLGLAPGRGSRQLAVANFGADEARASLQVVTEESTFTPEGADEIVIPPGTVQQVALDDLLGAQVAGGAVGLALEATHPVSAALRSFVAGDLSHATAASPVDGRAVALPPAGGRSTLLLAGSPGRGVARVTSYDAEGGRLGAKRVEVIPQRATRLVLPEGAAYAEVRLERTTAVAGLLNVTPRGAVVLPLATLVEDALVPAVGPGLP